jgi:hypothetical protein
MMKKAFIPSVVFLATVLCFAGFYYFGNFPHSNLRTEGKATVPCRRLSTLLEKDGTVRAFYVIVDRDGVYFGDQCVDFKIANTFLGELAKKEQIGAVSVQISEVARYGDAVSFYTGIDRSKFYVTSFPTHAISPGFRLPTSGTFRKSCCSWVDEANQEELF